MQPGRKLKILIEHGIRKAKTLLQLKLARNVNSKNKDLCKYIDSKAKGSCEENVEGIVVFKALQRSLLIRYAFWLSKSLCLVTEESGRKRYCLW